MASANTPDEHACTPAGDHGDSLRDLRARAVEAASPEAREVDWYCSLGDPRTAPAPNLVAMIAYAPVAEEEARRIQRERAEEQRRRDGEAQIRRRRRWQWAYVGFVLVAVVILLASSLLVLNALMVEKENSFDLWDSESLSVVQADVLQPERVASLSGIAVAGGLCLAAWVLVWIRRQPTDLPLPGVGLVGSVSAGVTSYFGTRYLEIASIAPPDPFTGTALRYHHPPSYEPAWWAALGLILLMTLTVMLVVMAWASRRGGRAWLWGVIGSLGVIAAAVLGELSF